ncbi:uncharacterized protein N7496_000969 [Penicillium cataractarum]|uniref:Uncharacterized protein n=1 Tax=Penicillium cataractarum TaxID=2100454 RepID=A0A9X0B6H9_9EURO|nr:uncharacterized protein N7496_000969 [Penicillium cataractarum]KAJ5389901.1 hypothetical protein N7496_000969 [Penicillium cataractarum]
MLFTFRPPPLGSVMKSVRCRTPGLYQRFPNLLSNSVLRSLSDCHASELSGPSFGRSCEKADREAYRKIFINDDQHNLEHTFQLLMDIVKRPCLGHFVERIEYVLTPSDGGDYPELPYQRNLSADDMHLLRRAVQNAGFLGNKEERIINMLMQTKLDHDLGYNNPDGCRVWRFGITPTYITQAIVALIVSMSPNIETMAMTQPFYHYSELEEEGEWARELPLVQVFRSANSRPEGTRFLQKLREVYLINRGDCYTSDSRFYMQADLIACLELFNKLPSIESFGIDVFEPDENNGKQTCEQASSNISKIKINHSSLPSSYLLCVMASSKTLTELQYTLGGRASLDGGYHMFNPKAFIKGLSAHKKTLQVLDIDTEDFPWKYPDAVTSQHSYSTDWEKYGGPGEFEFDAYDPDELGEDDPDLKMHRYLTSIWDRDASLKDFVALEELRIGIGFLIYFAQGVEIDDAKRGSVRLVDSLPDSLEYLSIRGYKRGANEAHDKEVAALMAQFDSGSLRLKEIKGVNEIIPNGYHIENPDENDHLLWSLEEVGFSDY